MPQTVQKVTKEENARENKDEEKTTDKEKVFLEICFVNQVFSRRLYQDVHNLIGLVPKQG